MSGLCNTSYSVVSQIDGLVLPLEKVTDRLYRGFVRSESTMQAVRGEFLENKSKMMAILEDHRWFFESPKVFEISKKYISDFFVILESPAKFKSEILIRARTK
jgi:hypothetical protein